MREETLAQWPVRQAPASVDDFLCNFLPFLQLSAWLLLEMNFSEITKYGVFTS
jgi:hypothetical protein